MICELWRLEHTKTAHGSHQNTNQAHHTKDGCTQAHWIDKNTTHPCIFGLLWYFANARQPRTVHYRQTAPISNIQSSRTLAAAVMRRMPPRLWIASTALWFRLGGHSCLPIFKMCFNLSGFKLPLYGKVGFNHRNLQREGKYLPL
jgi:hypothetical protein